MLQSACPFGMPPGPPVGWASIVRVPYPLMEGEKAKRGGRDSDDIVSTTLGAGMRKPGRELAEGWMLKKTRKEEEI